MSTAVDRYKDRYDPLAKTPPAGTPIVRRLHPALESSSAMKDFKLPHAIVIFGILACLAFLAWQKIDNGPIVMGALAILTALGFVIKQGAEQGEQNRNIQMAVNGNNHGLVETIKHQHAEAQAAAAKEREAFLALVGAHQEAMRAEREQTNQHFRELADKLAMMVPAAVIPTVVGAVAPTSGGPFADPMAAPNGFEGIPH